MQAMGPHVNAGAKTAHTTVERRQAVVTASGFFLKGSGTMPSSMMPLEAGLHTDFGACVSPGVPKSETNP